MYQKEDVRKIFEQEKILVGNQDVFPEYKAIEIFGKNAIEFAHEIDSTSKKIICSRYGIGDFDLKFLTIIGVEIAATYVNICALREGGVKDE